MRCPSVIPGLSRIVGLAAALALVACLPAVAQQTTLRASFDASRALGQAPLAVSFTDQSSGDPTSWEWDFDGDGSVDSTDRNPSHTYSTPGNYSVGLRVTNPGGIDNTVRRDFVVAYELSTNTMSPEVLSLQFNEVRGVEPNLVANASSTRRAPEFSTIRGVGPDGWATDSGRAEFGPNDRGFGALAATGRGGNNLIDTGWPMQLSSYTISWWQRLDFDSSRELAYIFGGPGSDFRCFTRGAAGNHLFFRGGGPGDFPLLVDVFRDQFRVWNHIALSVDINSGLAGWFFNGEVQQFVQFTRPTEPSRNDEFHVNYHQDPELSFSRYFAIDDFRVYHRALTPAEVLEVMENEPPVSTAFGSSCPGPAGSRAPTLQANGPPRINSLDFAVRVAGVPAGDLVLFFAGVSAVSDPSVGITLPLPLDSLLPGTPSGCQLEVLPFSSRLDLADTSGQAVLRLPIPDLPEYIGTGVLVQALVLGNTSSVSNALSIHLGR